MNTSKKQVRKRLARVTLHKTEAREARSTQTKQSERRTLLQTEVEHSPTGEATARRESDAV